MPARFPSLLRALAGATALSAIAAAQSAPTTLVLEGDVVPGVGAITTIDNLAINSAGDWLVESDTDNPDTTIDGVMIKNGALYLREGQALAAPVGASIGSFDAVTLSSSGHSGWNFFLDNTGSTSTDSGIFFDDVLVLQESTISGAAGFSAGTPYIGFFETKINASNQILVMASVDDPLIASTVDRALVVMQVDAFGNLISETVLHKEGDVLPGQTDLVADFGTGPHAFDYNELGHVLYIADLDGLTTTDGCIYLDGTLLAQEGSPSPVAGRNWSSLSTSQRVALNNSDEYVYTGSLDGSTTDNSVIIKNNTLFRQEGDTLPAIAPFLFTSFGTSAPLDIDDAGNVLWFGDWDDPDTTRDTGLFLNDTLLVQEGVTTVGGQVLEALSGVQDGYALSPNGDFVIFEGTLVGGFSGAFLIDLTGCPPPATYCTAKLNSLGCTPAISLSASPTATPGGGATATASNLVGGKLGLFLHTTFGPAALPLHNGFLCVGSPFRRHVVQSTAGTSGACDGFLSEDIDAYIDSGADPFLLAGATMWIQAWSRDGGDPFGDSLSDGVSAVICP